MRHRRTMANWTIITAALMTIALFGFAGRLLAQEASAAITPNFDAIPVFPGMTIVALAVTDNLPKPERDIVLQRRVGINPHDVILVRPGALRPELLAQAVATMQTMREADGRVPSRDALFVPEERPGLRPPRTNEAVGWVKSLRAVKTMNLPGVGPVPMIMVYLPDPGVSQK